MIPYSHRSFNLGIHGYRLAAMLARALEKLAHPGSLPWLSAVFAHEHTLLTPLSHPMSLLPHSGLISQVCRAWSSERVGSPGCSDSGTSRVVGSPPSSAAYAVESSDVSGLPVVAIPVLLYWHLTLDRYAAINRGGPYKGVATTNAYACYIYGW